MPHVPLRAAPGPRRHEEARRPQGLEDELRTIGFEREKRSFKPHLTIGRIRRQRNVHSLINALNSLKQFEADPFIADEFIFMRSELRPEGEVYTPIARYEMK